MIFNHCVKSVQIRSFFWSVFGQFSYSQYITKATMNIYNPRQNAWNKVKKSSLTGQHQKTLISTSE